MKAFQIDFSKTAIKHLKKVPSNVQGKIIRAIEQLKVNPFRGKKLQGELDGLYSLRVWPYRILYRVSKSELIIIVIDIGQRQGIYT